MAVVSDFSWYSGAFEEGFGNTVFDVYEPTDSYKLVVYLFEDGAYGTWADSLVDPDEQTAYFAHRWSSYTLAMHCNTSMVDSVDLETDGTAGYGCCIREVGEDEEETGGYCSIWDADNTNVIHYNLDVDAIESLLTAGDFSAVSENTADETFEGINQFTTLQDPNNEIGFSSTEFVAVKAQLFEGDEVIEFEYTTVYDMRLEKDMDIQGWIFNPNGADADAKWAITEVINLENGAMAAFQASAALVISLISLASF